MRIAWGPDAASTGAVLSSSAPASTGQAPATMPSPAAGASTVAVCQAVNGQTHPRIATAANSSTDATPSDLRPTPAVVVSSGSRVSSVIVPYREYRSPTAQSRATSPT